MIQYTNLENNSRHKNQLNISSNLAEQPSGSHSSGFSFFIPPTFNLPTAHIRRESSLPTTLSHLMLHDWVRESVVGSLYERLRAVGRKDWLVYAN